MYTEKQQKTMDNLDKGLKKVERQAQKNLNARLDNMRFCDYTRAEFNSTAPHAETDISFVLETDQSISLYKGDTQLSSQGSSVDVLYAALVGYGTGLGGERTGADEGYVHYNNRRTIQNDDPNDIFGCYNKDMSYWINTQGTEWGYTGAQRPTTAYVKGKGNFITTVDKGVIICNQTKMVVNSNVRRSDNYDFGRGLSGTSLLYQKSFYVRRILSNGYGPRETLTFSIEPYAMSYYNQTNSRVVISYTPYWRIKVSDGTNTRYLNGYYADPKTYYVADNNNGIYPSAGFTLGCKSIHHTDDDILYGQIRDPGLLWRGRSVILESSSNPYGLFYDIATGAALDPPTIEFYSEDERNLAYCLCLNRSVDI